MAKVAAQFRQVVEEVVLTLNGEEAETLRDILKHIAGCPDTSRRMHADAIANALDRHNIRGTGQQDIAPKSVIHFQ